MGTVLRTQTRKAQGGQSSSLANQGARDNEIKLFSVKPKACMPTLQLQAGSPVRSLNDSEIMEKQQGARDLAKGAINSHPFIDIETKEELLSLPKIQKPAKCGSRPGILKKCGSSATQNRPQRKVQFLSFDQQNSLDKQLKFNLNDVKNFKGWNSYL